MRRSVPQDKDNADDRDNVTIKSMLISLIRVCICSYFRLFTIHNILLKNIDTSSIVEVNDMSSNWLGWFLCYSFIFH